MIGPAHLDDLDGAALARPLPMVLPTSPVPVPEVDAATMMAVDRIATDELGIGLPQLMENAGRELATLVRLLLAGDAAGRRVLVLAGTGNNAGGGMVAARRLASWGADVTVVFARPIGRLRPGPCSQLESLIASGARLGVAGHDVPHPAVASLALGAAVVVDALIGYTLDGAPDETYQPLIGVTSLTDGRVVSLDLPSGIDASSGERPGAAVQADVTLALALPKVGSGRGQGRRCAGQRLAADIGIPPAAYARLGIKVGNIYRYASTISVD